MRQEGRGIGLHQQAQGLRAAGAAACDTVEANEELGFAPDLRDYGIGAQILADLGLSTIRIMTNNPKKIVALEGYGLTITGREQIEVAPQDDNMWYLRTKREKMGHLLEHESLFDGDEGLEGIRGRRGPREKELHMTTFEGKLGGKGLKFGLVVGRFNEFISTRLLRRRPGLPAAPRRRRRRRRHGLGAGRLRDAAGGQALADSGKYDAVVCLGAVIRGGTPHFDYVAGEAAKGIAKVSLDSGVPVIFGVLTTDTIEQAVERAGTKAGNKGWSAASTALEMANLGRALP